MRNPIQTILSAAALAAVLSAPGVVHAEVDDCLVGVWAADMEDMAHVFATQMSATSATVDGIAELRILPEGQAEMTFSDVAFDFLVPGNPPMKVVVTGVSDSAIDTIETFIWFRDNTSEISARAEFLGQVLEMSKEDFSPLTSGNFTAEFGCTESTLAFESENLGQIPRLWHRIAEDG